MKFLSLPRRRRAAGMTLMEMLVSVGIGGIVLAAVASISFYTARSFASLANYEDLDRLSRNALDQMTSKIRQTDGVTSFSADSITFSMNGTNTLTYTYNPSTRMLTEKLGNVSTVLLEECDSMLFETYSRNPVSNAFSVFPADNNTASIKLVQFSWSCSRQIMGQKVNTESIHSAKIVIRSQ